nr:MAG TPA: hypothetical protein [Crassvirales sp.]
MPYIQFTMPTFTIVLLLTCVSRRALEWLILYLKRLRFSCSC